MEALCDIGDKALANSGLGGIGAEAIEPAGRVGDGEIAEFRDAEPLLVGAANLYREPLRLKSAAVATAAGSVGDEA